MSTSKHKRLTSSSPEKDPLNLLETTPNKHKRAKKHSFDGEIISTSLSPINLNTSKKFQQQQNNTNYNRKIKNSSLLSLSTTGNNTHTSYQQHRIVAPTTTVQDEDDTLDGEDILDTSPIRFMMKNDENNNSPRTIIVPLAKEDDGLSPKNLLRNGTPAAKAIRKRKIFDFNKKAQASAVAINYQDDDSEFQSEEEEDDDENKVDIKVPKRDIMDTPLDSYKFPNLVTSTVSKSVKRNGSDKIISRERNNKIIERGENNRKRDRDAIENRIQSNEDEDNEPKKKRQVMTPKASDDTIDISDTISKASIYLDMKKKELQNRQEEKIVSKDTTGKILNFEEEVQQEEEEESDDLITELYYQNQKQNQHQAQSQRQQQAEHENYHLLQNWKSSKWNKLIKFLKIYQITKNDEMLSSKSIRQRFECDLDEIKLRIMILNKLNDRKRRV